MPLWCRSYGGRFLGMLESPADGVGAWSAGDMTLVANLANATFPGFVRLAAGEYGAAPLAADHSLVLVNAEVTCAADIGQPWDRCG